MKQRRIFIKYFVIVILICVFLFAVDLILSQKYISVTRYRYQNPEIKQSFKIVDLTDLHNYEYGAENRRLINKVKNESPDVIFLTGDMLNADEEQTDILMNLIQQLVKIAPVYASLGNHEIEYMQFFGNRNLIAQMEDPEQPFMEEFQDTDRFKILLSHMPEGLLLWKSMEYWDVDLVFSGHVHGGQMRIPFVGGLYDPEEGFFPTYTKGMYECGNGTMVLSAGLGSSRGIPRVNNLSELVVCEIDSDSGDMKLSSES